jgi:hypothetical protein
MISFHFFLGFHGTETEHRIMVQVQQSLRYEQVAARPASTR